MHTPRPDSVLEETTLTHSLSLSFFLSLYLPHSLKAATPFPTRAPLQPSKKVRSNCRVSSRALTNNNKKISSRSQPSLKNSRSPNPTFGVYLNRFSTKQIGKQNQKKKVSSHRNAPLVLLYSSRPGSTPHHSPYHTHTDCPLTQRFNCREKDAPQPIRSQQGVYLHAPIRARSPHVGHAAALCTDWTVNI